MLRHFTLVVLITTLAACADRGEIEFGAPAPDGTPYNIWVANFRPTKAPAEGQRSPPRPESIRYERDVVSVPPTHQTGQIEWPKDTPHAGTDFVTLSSQSLTDSVTFAKEVLRADATESNNTFLFVHGYNYTHGEAVYQLAQIAHDFEIPSPTVLFSWPSAAQPVGYLYDRDSALIARDQLEEVIVALTRKPGHKLVLLGHSMGNLLIMETLRQIEISGSVNIANKVETLIMVSPDIDGELFYTQASRLKAPPKQWVILATKQDRALRISALLTGRTNRLGSETDRGAVRDLPVTIIDTSDQSDGGLSHSVALTSPAAIAILKNADATLLPGELVKQSGVLKLSGLR